jgi:hypothetical protein
MLSIFYIVTRSYFFRHQKKTTYNIMINCVEKISCWLIKHIACVIVLLFLKFMQHSHINQVAN